MTQCLKKMYPDELADCVLCFGGEEDCVHLFFRCPFAQVIWATRGISSVDTTSEKAFWDSVRQVNWRQKEEGGKIIMVLWTICLHRNKALFKGRMVSTDGVIPDMEGLMASWFYHN